MIIDYNKKIFYPKQYLAIFNSLFFQADLSVFLQQLIPYHCETYIMNHHLNKIKIIN